MIVAYLSAYNNLISRFKNLISKSKNLISRFRDVRLIALYMVVQYVQGSIYDVKLRGEASHLQIEP